MTTLSLSVPQTGSPDATEEPKLASDMTALQSWANGNIDTDNLTAATSQAAGINTAGTKVKGSVLNAGPGTRTNVAYGALNDAADQVTGITLATNGLLRVWFQATWQESVANTARAALFIGANQLKVAANTSATGNASAQAIACAINGPGGDPASVNVPLTSCPLGVVSVQQTSAAGTPYGGDATTGQAVGLFTVNGSAACAFDIGGAIYQPFIGSGANGFFGGPCDVFAAAGTYTIAVNYKSPSGTVTASNRHLWVQAISFG